MENVDIKKEWESGIPSEISFWEDWIRTKGDCCGEAEDYKIRTDANSKLQDIFLQHINRALSKNKILDVGSEPLTAINKKCDLSELDIYATDPLAHEYNKILNKFGILPIVKIQKLEGERLTEKYGINTFDITYSRNALDHTYNPLKCIKEMIIITKRSGCVILQHYPNGALLEDWGGLHRWNFFLSDNKLFLKGKNTRTYNISAYLEEYMRLTSISMEDSMITTVYTKL